MNVETFECTETAAEPIEASEEAIRLMEELELGGQQDLICKTKANQTTRAPYREMTEEEYHVYRTLCPSSVKIERYKAAPIPLRVLQIAAHAKQCFPKAKLLVWDRESVTVKDPVLVAEMPNDTYDWQFKTRYILARWGEELETFQVLMKRAVSLARERLTQAAEALVSKVRDMPNGEIIKARQVLIEERHASAMTE